MSFCPKCGAQNPESNRFCTKCGSPLATIAPIQNAAATAVSVNQTMSQIDEIAMTSAPPARFELESASLIPMGSSVITVDESFVRGVFPYGRSLGVFSQGESRSLDIEHINDLGQPLQERRIGEGIKRGFFVFVIVWLVCCISVEIGSRTSFPQGSETANLLAMLVTIPVLYIYWRKSATLRIVPSSGEPLEIEVAWKNRGELIAMRKEIEKRKRASSRRAQMKLTALAAQATIANQQAAAQHTEGVMRQGFSDVVDAINNNRSDS